jgi:hypothetical protein
MATCIRCNKSGFFVSVNEKGLCNNCINTIRFDVQQKMKIIGDSNDIILKSKNIETIISRSDLAIEYILELSEYDQYKLFEINFSDFAKSFSIFKEESILKVLKTKYETVKEKLLTLSTVNSKVSQLNKLKMDVDKYYSLIKSYSGDLNQFSALIDNEISLVKFGDFFQKAKKSEFKGDKKKALDNYYEALYSLMTDNIQDDQQKSLINEIKAKIIELGGEIKEVQ